MNNLNKEIIIYKMSNKYYIGIDIGGTKCAVIRSDSEGKILDKVSFPTTDKDTALKKIFDAVESFLPAEAIGISCGGPLDERRGIILSPPNLPGWDEVRITDMLTERFFIPARLCNDASACALAEWQFGAGRGTENMIFLTFGTGLGAGLILDGKLYSGANGNAGEVGHIRLADDGPVGFGKAGSFEGFCSGGGIARLAKAYARQALADGAPISFAQSEADISNISTKGLADLAKSGNTDASRIFDISAEKLGQGLSLLIDILNPEVIVIGSVFARSEELFRQKMLDVIEKEALAPSREICRIVPAELGDSIGDVAAISVAINVR